MTQNEIRIEIDASTSELTKKLKKLESQLTGLDKIKLNGLTKQNNQLTRSFQQLATHVAKLATIYASFQGLVSAGISTADFEESIKKLGVYTGATAEELALLKEKALELGKSTVFSANQVASGLNEMGLAGLSATEQMNGIEDVLNLASFGMISLEDATRLSVTTMKSFGLQSTDIKAVTDVISKGATLSATTVMDLGDALGNVSPVAHSLNVSMYETVASLDVLADASIRGASAGTQLKMVMSRLAANPEAKKYLDELSISMYDANGHLLPFNEQLDVLNNALSGLSEATRNTLLGRIGGEEAKASLIALMTNTDKLREKTLQLKDAVKDGFASKSAKDMMDILKGSYKEFMSAINGLVLQIGEKLIPTIRGMLDGWTEAINGMSPEDINSISDSFVEFAESVRFVFDALGMLLKPIYDLSTSVPTLTAGVIALLLATKKLKGEALVPLVESLTGMTSIMSGPALVAVGLLATAIYDMYRTVKENDKVLTDGAESVENKLVSLTNSVTDHYDKTAKAIVLTKSEKDAYIKSIDREIKSTEEKLKVDEKWFQSTGIYEDTQKRLKLSLERLKEQKKVVTEATIADTEATKKATASRKSETQAIKDANAELIAVSDNIKKLENKYRDLETSAINSLNSQKQSLNKFNSELINLRNKTASINIDYYNKSINLEIDYQHSIANIKNDEKLKAQIARSEELNAKKAFYEENYKLAEDYYGDLIAFGDSLKVGSIATNGAILRDEQSVKKEKIRIATEVYNGRMAILEKEKIAELEANKQKIEMKLIEIELVKQQISLNETYLTKLKNGISDVNKNKLDFTDPKTDDALKSLNEMTAELKRKLSNIKVNIEDEKAKSKLTSLTDAKYDIKLDANTTQAKSSISNLKTSITPIDIPVKSDTRPLVTEMRLVRGTYQSIPINIPFGMEEEYLDRRLREIRSDISTTQIDMPVGADTEPSKRNVGELIGSIEATTPVTQPLYIDFSNAVEALGQFLNYANNQTVKIEAYTGFGYAVPAVEQFVYWADSQYAIIEIYSDLRYAVSALDNFIAYANSQTATIKVYEKIIQTRSGGGYIPSYATGGTFTGSGRVGGYDPTDSDKVNAYLTGGEFVVNRRATDKYGLSTLNAINNGTANIPSYSSGGYTGEDNAFMLPDVKQDFVLTSNANEISKDFNNLQKSISYASDETKKYNFVLLQTDEKIKTVTMTASKSARSVGMAMDSYADAIGRLAYYTSHPASTLMDKLMSESENFRIRRYASGGYISGYDPTDSDKVPIMATGGEYIINRKATNKYGVGLFNMFNDMEVDIKGYASGGYVGSASTSTKSGIIDTVKIEFNIGDKSFEAYTEREIANSLKLYAQRWGRE